MEWSSWQILPMSGELEKKVAKFLKERRGEQTFKVFGRKLGISASTLFRLENLEQSPTLEKFEQILDRLKCSYKDVFEMELPSPSVKETSKSAPSTPTQSAKYPKKRPGPKPRKSQS